MLKAIFAKHVKPGDEILVSGGKRLTVETATQWNGRVRLSACERGEDVSSFYFNEYDIVGLGHRPLPDGKTELEMLDSVDSCVTAYRLGLVKPEIGRKAILEALEAYELGKPGVKP